MNSSYLKPGRLALQAVAVSALLLVAGATSAQIHYSDFSTTDGLTLLGTATRAGNVLRLTPARAIRPCAAGGAWYSVRQSIRAGFTSRFAFRITHFGDTTGAADGLAFVIQDAGPRSLGPGGGYLGYDGIGRSLAIEFDEYTNPQLADPDDNHISIHTRGIRPNSASHAAALATTSGIPNLQNGEIYTVTVDYVPGTLSVYFNGSQAPLLTIQIDLAATLGTSDGAAWVGFTSGICAWYANHDILFWNFEPTPAP
jgi:hypothetical protein